MHTRRNAALLTQTEREHFLRALIEIKHTPAPGAPQGVSIYDRFVATHGAIMEISVGTPPTSVNMGHWHIGFLPWHREFLRRFELELQAVVPEARLPYWNWTDHATARARVFIDDFMGPLRGMPIASGWFRSAVPANERPAEFMNSLLRSWPLRECTT